MSGDQGALDLRQDRAAQAVQTGPGVAVLRQGVEQVGPQLLTQGADGEIGGAQLAQGADVREIAHTFTLALHRDSTSGLAVPGWVLSR